MILGSMDKINQDYRGKVVHLYKKPTQGYYLETKSIRSKNHLLKTYSLIQMIKFQFIQLQTIDKNTKYCSD